MKEDLAGTQQQSILFRLKSSLCAEAQLVAPLIGNGFHKLWVSLGQDGKGKVQVETALPVS